VICRSAATVLALNLQYNVPVSIVITTTDISFAVGDVFLTLGLILSIGSSIFFGPKVFVFDKHNNTLTVRFPSTFLLISIDLE
jgi:hypothetical protein